MNRSLHCVLIQFPLYVSLIITFSISCVTVLCKVAVACSVDDVEGLDTENDMLSSLFGVGSVYVLFSLAAIPLARRDTVNGHLLRSPGSLKSGIYKSPFPAASLLLPIPLWLDTAPSLPYQSPQM
ncbi:hypothetical protein BDQ17DRAFT_1385084 [Cyathus striatus]|nr:hypothetical protein BDQ17DRAFT_1385084 [Cyathus striatus]